MCICVCCLRALTFECLNLHLWLASTRVKAKVAAAKTTWVDGRLHVTDNVILYLVVVKYFYGFLVFYIVFTCTSLDC